MKKPPGIRLVCVVSDIHAGSTVAIMPPEFTTKEEEEEEEEEEVTIAAGPVQRFFWECWQDAIGWVDEMADGDPLARGTDRHNVSAVRLRMRVINAIS